MTDNLPKQSLFSRLIKHLLIVEIVLSVILLIAFYYRSNTVFGSPLLIVTIVTWAIVYFFSGINKTENVTGILPVFSQKISFISLVLLLIFILFQIQHWPKSESIFYIGILSSILSIILMLIKPYQPNNLLRCAIVMGIAILFFIFH